MTALPTLPTVTSGILTSTELAKYVAWFNFLSAPPRAELRQSVAQSVPSGVWTALTFDAEDADLDPNGNSTQHDAAVNTSRFTAVYPGRYLFAGAAGFVANAAGRRGCRWALNGTAVNGAEALVQATTANSITVPSRVKSIYLNIGDYVELQGFQESGGALNTGTATGGATLSALWVASS